MTATALEPTGDTAVEATQTMDAMPEHYGRQTDAHGEGRIGATTVLATAKSPAAESATASFAAESAQAADTAMSPAAAATPELLPLRRNRNFNLLWGGAVSALLGLSTADIAYPLVILALTGSPLKAGLFATVQLIASVLATLPVGQLMDRKDRRRMLLLSESVRVVAAGSVAVAYFVGALTFWHLLLTAAALGAIQPFAGARTLLLRQVVAPEQISAALTAEQVRQQGCELAGPPLGGAMFGISRALPFLFATFAGLVSLLTVVLLKLPKSVTLAGDQGDAGASEQRRRPRGRARRRPPRPEDDHARPGDARDHTGAVPGEHRRLPGLPEPGGAYAAASRRVRHHRAGRRRDGARRPGRDGVGEAVAQGAAAGVAADRGVPGLRADQLRDDVLRGSRRRTRCSSRSAALSSRPRW